MAGADDSKRQRDRRKMMQRLDDYLDKKRHNP